MRTNDPTVRALLMRTLVDSNLLSVAGLFWAQIGWLAAYLLTGWAYLAAFSVMDLLLFIGKWRIRHRLVTPVNLSSIGIYLTANIISFVFLVSIEIAILFVIPSVQATFLATMLAVGWTGYAATLYAGCPRLAVLSIAAFNIPFIIGLATSFVPDVHILTPLAPCVGVAFALLMQRVHGSLLEAVQAQHRHFEQSRQDPLTGLSNRRVLLERLSCHCASRETRKGTDACLGVLCLDLDGFKDVNDRFGHAAGDRVLVGVSDRLRAVTRAADAICRVGGDEFVVLLPAADRSVVHAIAKRIVEAVAEPMEIGEAAPVIIGVSIGIAFLEGDATTPEQVLSAADAALYDAKTSGKGRFKPARTSVARACFDDGFANAS